MAQDSADGVIYAIVQIDPPSGLTASMESRIQVAVLLQDKEKAEAMVQKLSEQNRGKRKKFILRETTLGTAPAEAPAVEEKTEEAAKPEPASSVDFEELDASPFPQAPVPEAKPEAQIKKPVKPPAAIMKPKPPPAPKPPPPPKPKIPVPPKPKVAARPKPVAKPAAPKPPAPVAAKAKAAPPAVKQKSVPLKPSEKLKELPPGVDPDILDDIRRVTQCRKIFEDTGQKIEIWEVFCLVFMERDDTKRELARLTMLKSGSADEEFNEGALNLFQRLLGLRTKHGKFVRQVREYVKTLPIGHFGEATMEMALGFTVVSARGREYAEMWIETPDRYKIQASGRFEELINNVMKYELAVREFPEENP